MDEPKPQTVRLPTIDQSPVLFAPDVRVVWDVVSLTLALAAVGIVGRGCRRGEGRLVGNRAVRRRSDRGARPDAVHAPWPGVDD